VRQRQHRQGVPLLLDPQRDLKELEASLAQFVYEHNHIRPHEALDTETPIEWYNARAA